MRLMGFKSMSTLKLHQNIRPSYFIYPDEKVIKGSSQAFHAMILSLTKKKKYALVRFIPRDGGVLRFCALLPQEESFQKENGHYTPPGFNLIFLPFSEDSRDIETSLSSSEKLANPENTDLRLAKLFIKNMSIDFDSRNFENPTIQKFYSGLQSLALGEEIEEIHDTLEPDSEGMKNMEDIINKYKNNFRLGSVKKETSNKPKIGKRKKPEEDKEVKQEQIIPKRANKRLKAKEDSDNEKEVRPLKNEEAKLTDKRIKEMCDEGELMQLTLNRLKQLCQDRNIQPKKATKRELVELLQKFVDKAKY